MPARRKTNRDREQDPAAACVMRNPKRLAHEKTSGDASSKPRLSGGGRWQLASIAQACVRRLLPNQTGGVDNRPTRDGKNFDGRHDTDSLRVVKHPLKKSLPHLIEQRLRLGGGFGVAVIFDNLTQQPLGRHLQRGVATLQTLLC